MKKSDEPQVKKSSPKKQRSQWQQQELRQRIIGIIGVAVVAVVAVVLVSGWFFKQYLPIDRHMRTTVMEVCGQKYDMAYFVDMLAYLTGENAKYGFAGYYVDEAAQLIERVGIINNACAKLGISVTDEDVSQYIKEYNSYYGIYYGLLPDNAAVRDLVRASLYERRIRDDYFGPDVPITAEHREVVAMLLESQSQLEDIRTRLVLGEDFDKLAAEYSLDSITKEDSALGSHPKGVFDFLISTKGMDDAIFNQAVNSWGVYYDDSFEKELGYWLVKVTERNAESGEVRVSGMLLSSLEEANTVKTKLNAGGSFTALAEQYSQCWSDEGKDDLGWMSPTGISAAYKSYVLDEDTAIGKVSDPIKDDKQHTEGGYWLFKVVSISPNGNITPDDRANLTKKAFNDWLEEIKADTQTYSVVNYLDDKMREFAAARVNK